MIDFKIPSSLADWLMSNTLEKKCYINLHVTYEANITFDFFLQIDWEFPLYDDLAILKVPSGRGILTLRVAKPLY